MRRGPAKRRTALFALRSLGRKTGADRSVLVRVKSPLLELDGCERLLELTARNLYLSASVTSAT